MICRLEPGAAVLAFALMLAGCGMGGAASDAADTQGQQRTAAQTRLMAEAETALAEGRLAEAGQALDQALAIDPENPDTWVAIARLRFRGGEHLTAIEAADRALALGPDHAPAMLMRSLLVRDAHGFAAAVPWFEALLAAHPDHADGWAEYAATLGDMGEARAMLAAVRRLAEVAPDDARVLYLQAVLAARGGEPALARSLLTRSGMAARGVPAAMLLDAALSLEQGSPSSAAAVLEQLAARQPANARARELLARALLDSGREGELLVRFGAEAQQPETSAYMLALIARAYERSGDRARAAPLLDRAYASPPAGLVVLAERPGLPQPTAALRKAAAGGQWSAAAKLAEDLQTRFPASADAASLSGDIALGAGNPAAALAHYAQAVRARRPWRMSAKAALAFTRAGDTDAALAVLARHVAGEPDNGDAATALARTLAEAGEWERAAALLDHVIALGEGHDPVVMGLRLRAARALGREEEALRFAQALAEIRPARLAAP